MTESNHVHPCHVEMLGGLRIDIAGEVNVHLRVQKAGELLALLCSHPDRAFNRDEVVEYLWPGADPDVGRNRLRFTLSCLRRIVEPLGVPRGSVLISGRGQLAVRGSVISTDVAAFSECVHVARTLSAPTERVAALKRAAEVYGGDFMPGFYADWVEAERQRLSTLFTDAMCELALLLEDRRDLDGAHEAASRAVSSDPWREEAHRCLLRVHLARGEAGEALSHYADLKRALENDLGTEPDPETQAIIADLSRGSYNLPRVGSVRRTARTFGEDAQVTHPQRTIVSEPPKPDGSHYSVPTPIPPRRGPLPSHFTKFVGRERELADIQRMILDGANRLVTLSGLGGVGKTRIAVEACRRLSESAALSVLYLDLLTCATAQAIPEAVAGACGVRPLPGRTLLEQITETLQGQRCVLVLDNCEHLLPEAGSITHSMLAAISTLSCLATSRIALEIAGEREYAVDPLAVPDDSGPEELSRWDSVALFVNRARLVRANFTVTKRNASDLCAICRALDGIPLALELAAAWCGSLSPAEIRARLNEPFELLVSHGAGFPLRHRALSAVLDQSYSDLPDEAKILFARLAIFQGTWNADATEAVCGPDALRWLDYLRRSSLVTAEGAGEAVCFRLLEPVREFAWSHLSVEERSSVATRHAEVYRDQGLEAREHLDGPEADLWLDRLAADEANLLAAAKWCFVNQRQPEIGVGIAESLRGLWEMRGYQAERCRRLMSWLSGVPDRVPSVGARALGCASYMARLQGGYREAYSLLWDAVALFRQSDDHLRLGFNLCLLGQLAQFVGEPDAALSLHQESLGLLRQIDHAWGVAMVQSSSAKILAFQGRCGEARPLALESLDAYRSMGDRTATATVLSIVALIHYFQGNLEGARELERESLSIRREINRPWGVAYSLVSLGRVAFQRHRLDESIEDLSRGLELFNRLGDIWGIAYASHHLGLAVHARGEQRVGKLLADALRYRHHVGIPAEIAESLEAHALLAVRSSPASAIRLLEAASTLRHHAGVPVPLIDRWSIGVCGQKLRKTLGERRFAQAATRGREMSVEEAIACAVTINEMEPEGRRLRHHSS